MVLEVVVVREEAAAGWAKAVAVATVEAKQGAADSTEQLTRQSSADLVHQLVLAGERPYQMAD